MAVSLDQLQAFVAAAEAGSFSGAARILRKAQSAVSTQVANLETDLGLALFSRAGRNPVLTAAGERLLLEARVVLDRREHLVGVARSLEQGVENRLVVAIDELYPEHALGALFADFAKAFPNVELELLFPLMEDVSRMVRSGAADLGVMWRQEVLPTELGFQTIGWVPLKLVCGRDHPLAKARVEWEELKRHRQILVAARGDGPEVDGQAASLLASLRTLNPSLKALTRYQATREFKEDGFRFAREQHPILVPLVEAAAKAMDAYGTALFDREMARDQRRAAAMPEAAPARRLLDTSLALKQAVKRFEALGPKSEVAPFLAALGEVSTANRQLGTTFDALAPKADSTCTGYADTVASVIGHGRDVARDIKAKGDPSQPAQLFNDTYNRSVRDLESCLRNETRARPG